MEHNYYAKVVTKGEQIPDELLVQMEKTFVRMYNEFVDMTNPLFEGWNNIWEHQYKKEFDTPEYEEFITDKMEAYAQIVNKQHPWAFVRLHVRDVETYGVGHWPWNKTELHWYIWEET